MDLDMEFGTSWFTNLWISMVHEKINHFNMATEEGWEGLAEALMWNVSFQEAVVGDGELKICDVIFEDKLDDDDNDDDNLCNLF